jgi:predicted RNA-binding Zn-ribbon protein involved in translation (DUF1610 family)
MTEKITIIKTGDGPEVAVKGTPVSLDLTSIETISACVECGWTSKRTQGVASCPVCGGKVVITNPFKVRELMDKDAKRFSSDSE